MTSLVWLTCQRLCLVDPKSHFSSLPSCWWSSFEESPLGCGSKGASRILLPCLFTSPVLSPWVFRLIVFSYYNIQRKFCSTSVQIHVCMIALHNVVYLSCAYLEEERLSLQNFWGNYFCISVTIMCLRTRSRDSELGCAGSTTLARPCLTWRPYQVRAGTGKAFLSLQPWIDLFAQVRSSSAGCCGVLSVLVCSPLSLACHIRKLLNVEVGFLCGRSCDFLRCVFDPVPVKV